MSSAELIPPRHVAPISRQMRESRNAKRNLPACLLGTDFIPLATMMHIYETLTDRICRVGDIND